MTDFMEVFAVTHLTYVFFLPCFVVFIAVAMKGTGEVLSCQAGNLFAYIFCLVVMLLVFGKSFDTVREAPYVNARMEQFGGGDSKLKSLSY